MALNSLLGNVNSYNCYLSITSINYPEVNFGIYGICRGFWSMTTYYISKVF